MVAALARLEGRGHAERGAGHRSHFHRRERLGLPAGSLREHVDVRPQAHPLERQAGDHVRDRLRSIDGDGLAAQVLGRLDLRPHVHAHLRVVRGSADDHRLEPLQVAQHQGSAASVGDVQLAAVQRGDQCGARGDVGQLDVQLLLAEVAAIRGDPPGKDRRRDRAVSCLDR